MKATTAYTTTARQVETDPKALRNLRVTFRNGTVIEASDLEDFHKQWESMQYPDDITGCTSNGYKAVVYPTVFALGSIAAAVLSADAGAPVFVHEGRTYKDFKSAKKAIWSLAKLHAQKGSKLYGDPETRRKAFAWTGRVFDPES